MFGFFPALNIVTDEFIELIRKRRTDFTVRGFEELAYRMGLESESSTRSPFPALFRIRIRIRRLTVSFAFLIRVFCVSSRNNACHLAPLRRHVHADPGTSPGLPETGLQQHAHRETGGGAQDSLHGAARRLLRPAALEAAADIRVQAGDRERGHHIQVSTFFRPLLIVDARRAVELSRRAAVRRDPLRALDR